MITSPEQVRQRVRDVILARDGYRESTSTYERFGLADSESLYHRAFAVGYLSAIPQSERQPSRGLPAMAPVVATVGVRFAWELAAKNEMSTYDAGLLGGRQLAAALVAGGRSQGLHLILTSLSYSTVDGWLVGEIILSARHNLDLTM